MRRHECRRKAVPPPPPVGEPIEVAEFAEEAEPVELPQPVEPPKKAEPALPVAAARAVQKPWVAVPAPPLVEPAESRGFASVLQAFMEESNIRWGELLSGLLIVGSSVGLVISLWATLEKAIPYFPVAVFLVATAAMHGAGLYTLKYWRLKATSRGLLLVSTLLVPLNVLAAIALNDRNPDYFPIDYAAVTVGLAVLAAIVYSAARILNKHNPWPMFLRRGGRGRWIVLHRPAGEPRRVGRADPVVVRASRLRRLPWPPWLKCGDWRLDGVSLHGGRPSRSASSASASSRS